MTICRWSTRQSRRLETPLLRLSFAVPAIHVIRVFQWALSSLLCTALAIAVWCWWSSQALEEAAVRYDLAATRTEDSTRQFSAQMQQDQLNMTIQQIAAIRQDIAIINQLAEKRLFSWTQLLVDLEEALPPGTSIGKIQLDVKDSTVKIDGVAAQMQDLYALIARLQKRPVFTQVVLHNHKFVEGKGSREKTDEGDNGDSPDSVGVEYSLTVTYRPSS